MATATKEAAGTATWTDERTLRIETVSPRETLDDYTVTLLKGAAGVVGAVLVKARKPADEYHVDLRAGHCTCPDHKFRPRPSGCKHIVGLRLGLQARGLQVG